MEGFFLEMEPRTHKPSLGSVEDATKRHIEKQTSLRRNQRDVQRQRIRGIVHVESDLNQLIQKYDKTALLDNGDVVQLDLLSRIFASCSDAELEQYLPQLILTANDEPRVLFALVYALGTAHALQAASCLVNLTGAKTRFALLCGQALFKSNILGAIYPHLRSRSQCAVDLWIVIANIICLCPEARDLILDSVIFRESADGPPPFALELNRGDDALCKCMLLIICGSVEASEMLPPEPFIWACWSHVVPMLIQQKKIMENDNLEYIMATLDITASRLCATDRGHQLLTRMIGQFETKYQLLTFLVRLCSDMSGWVRLSTLKLLTSVSFLNVPNNAFQCIMRDAGCVELMKTAVETGPDRCTNTAISWLENYVTEGFDFVKDAHTRGVFYSVGLALRSHALKGHLVHRCLALFERVCQICLTDLPASGNFLSALLDESNIVQIMIQYFDQTGVLNSTERILRLWIDLRRWNKEKIHTLLTETSAMDRIERLIHSPNDTISRLAEEIACGNDDMDTF